MPDHIRDARRLIETRLAEIEAEARSLERAVVSLEKGSGSPQRRPGRPSKLSAASPSDPIKPRRRSSRKRKAGRPRSTG